MQNALPSHVNVERELQILPVIDRFNVCDKQIFERIHKHLTNLDMVETNTRSNRIILCALIADKRSVNDPLHEEPAVLWQGINIYI